MSVFRVEKNANYTVMCNVHLQDKSLSLKAKGLLSQMLSLPDDWDYTLRGLAAINKEAVNTIGGIVNELISAGYIVREQSRSEGGCFAESSYVIYEVPHIEQEDVNAESSENTEDSPYLKNCDTVEMQENKVSSPCLKNCDTVQPLENRAIQPCRKKPYTENCDNNKILNNKVNNIYNPSIYQSMRLPYERIKRMVKENVRYDDLKTVHPEQVDMIDGLMDIIIDILMSNESIIRIGQEEKSSELVKSNYMKLRYEHIEYILCCLEDNCSEIKNVPAYLKTMLYNAPTTCDVYWQSRVNHDKYHTKKGFQDSG